MTAPHRTTPLLQLLARQRSVVTYPGEMLATVLNRLAFLEQQTLIELRDVSMPGTQPQPCFLLLHGGGVVHAECGELLGQAALERAAQLSALGTLHLYALSAEGAALALASVDGSVTALDRGPESDLKLHLARLSDSGFSGVLLGRERAALTMWLLEQGELRGRQELGEAGTWHGWIQLAWQPRALPRLSVPAFLPPAPLQVALHDDAVWNAFGQVLRQELGSASARLLALLQGHHAGESGVRLRDSLAQQVERVAGIAARQQFQRQLGP